MKLHTDISTYNINLIEDTIGTIVYIKFFEL